MNAIPINVKRTDAELAPDPTRVLLRSFTPGDVPRLERIVTGIMSISENDVWPLLDAVPAIFPGRPKEMGDFWETREVLRTPPGDRPAFQGTIQAIARGGFPRSGPFRAATTTNRSVFRLRVLCRVRGTIQPVKGCGPE